MLLWLLVLLQVCQAAYHVEYHKVDITVWDGVVLTANAAVPTPTHANETFPLIMLPNSWDLPDVEYILKVLEWAEQGYVTLEYETRGFYTSGGEINVAGPEDMKDVTSILDFVLMQKWHVDSTKISMCGLSYGAGISLLGAAHDDRIAVAVALSGWPSLLDALFGDNTPSNVWGNLLIDTAKIFGHEPPVVGEIWNDILKYENMTFARAWAAQRSVNTMLGKLEARKVPVFISNNYEDRLFKPQYALNFYQDLQLPKFVLLNQGIHASAEISGLLSTKSNFVWAKTKLWLDYWLKGVENGVTSEPPLQFQLRDYKNTKERVTFSSWPSPNVHNVVYNLHARGASVFGSLSASAAHTGDDRVSFSKTSGMSAGIPIVGPILQVYVDHPIEADLVLVERTHAVVYTTATISGPDRLCGTPNATIYVSSNQPKFQVVLYLWDMDMDGVARLVSHSPYSVHESSPGNITKLDFSLRSLCVNIDAGHKLALGMNLYDDLYAPVNEAHALEVTVHAGASTPSGLALPHAPRS